MSHPSSSHPPDHHPSIINRKFGRIATVVAHASGKPITFLICVAIVLIWAAFGPVFNYSDTWQLIINTGTTIVTFLMV